MTSQQTPSDKWGDSSCREVKLSQFQEDFTRKKFLGRGSHGAVGLYTLGSQSSNRYKNIDNGVDVVIKLIDLDEPRTPGHALTRMWFDREIRALRAVWLGCSRSRLMCFLTCLELQDRGQTVQLAIISPGLRMMSALSEDMSRSRRQAGSPTHVLEQIHLMDQIMSSVVRIHSLGVTHTDLKPGNIVTFKDQTTHRVNAMVIDFGSACTKTDSRCHSQTLGTLQFTSPTILDMKVNVVKVTLGFDDWADQDLFSLGVTFFMMLTGTHPSQFVDELKGVSDPEGYAFVMANRAKWDSSRQVFANLFVIREFSALSQILEPLFVFVARLAALDKGDRFPNTAAAAASWSEVRRAVTLKLTDLIATAASAVQA